MYTKVYRRKHGTIGEKLRQFLSEVSSKLFERLLRRRLRVPPWRRMPNVWAERLLLPRQTHGDDSIIDLEFLLRVMIVKTWNALDRIARLCPTCHLYCHYLDGPDQTTCPWCHSSVDQKTRRTDQLTVLSSADGLEAFEATSTNWGVAQAI